MAGNFYGVVTRTGHGLITAALASGTRVNLTHIALGDGGGAAVAPSEEMQALVNEVHRAPINTLAQDPANAALMWAEVVLPANVGGWYIREAGILDEEGNLVAVAGTPESYKPALAEGSGSEFVLRLPLVLTNTESVTLRIDPTVVLASREHVAGTVAGHNAAADAHADIRASVDAVAAAVQEGDGHAERRDNPHEVTCGQVGAAPVDHVHPASQITGLAESLAAAIPPGTVAHIASGVVPDGWLERNGAAVSRETYAGLFAVVGTTFGAGDGVGTFNLPDDRGLFDRAWDNGAGVDSGRVLGSAQEDSFRSHSHSGASAGPNTGGDNTSNGRYYCAGPSSTGAAGGAETRPRNRAYLAIIKY